MPQTLLGNLETLPECLTIETKQDQPVRLSIITQFHPPDYAATGQLIAELANQLGNFGMEVHVFTGQPGYVFEKMTAPKRETLEQVFIRRSRTSRIWPHRIRGRALNGVFFCLRALLHLLRRRNRQDILLITTEPPYLPILGYLAYLLFGIPYVCLLYDLYPDVAVQLKVVPATHWIVRLWTWLNCQVWKQAQSIIVLSSTMKERVAKKCPEVQDKIQVIHSWADPQRIQPLNKDKNWFAHQYNLTDKFTVLYSGNMGRCHDMDTIMIAVEELKNDPIQFVFIGHGAKRQACIERAERFKLKNCLFLPYQDKSVLPYSLTACDLSLVSIDKGIEGLVAPSKLYGILAAGRPVAAICEPHSYLRDLLREANCGKTFNNGDGKSLAHYIRHLAENSQVAENLGKSGRNYLTSNFTPDRIAIQYLEVLKKANLNQKYY
ncbi:MAG: glycosyltransferase family 4 protein [Halothece sp.]